MRTMWLGLMVGCACVGGEMKVGAAGAETSGSATQPNIIIIFADDMGYGDLSCYGQTHYKTPQLDKMAKEGVRLTEFYVTSPACSPSRASLLTGQYPMRAGVPQVLNPQSDTGMAPDLPQLPQMMRDRGYITEAVGKWHLGHKPEFMPTKKGFDRFFGLPYSNDMKPLPLFRDDKIIEANVKQETLTKRYTEECLSFIDQAGDKKQPFFLYMAHTFPHVPLHVSPDYDGKSGAGLYGDVMTEIDWSVGEILKHLQEKKLADNTLVIFTSDNGPWTIQGANGGSTGGLRGAKGTDYEGGVREPFIAWWPGTLPQGKVVDVPAITLDLLPTLTALADGKSNAGNGNGADAGPGKNIWPVLSEGKSVGERTFYFPDYYVKNPVGSIRKGDFKLVTGRAKLGKHDARTTELFNLKKDAFEKHDLSAEHPDMVKMLAAEADAKRAEFIRVNPWGKDVSRKSQDNLKYVQP